MHLVSESVIPEAASAAADKVAAADRSLVCPRCEMPALREMVHLGVPIDVCRRCGGVWLDAGELERVVAAVVRPLLKRSRLRLASNLIDRVRASGSDA